MSRVMIPAAWDGGTKLSNAIATVGFASFAINGGE